MLSVFFLSIAFELERAFGFCLKHAFELEK